MKTLQLNDMENVQGRSCATASAALGVSVTALGFSLLGGPIGFGFGVVGLGFALYNQAEACR
jgi:hypothetical protein